MDKKLSNLTFFIPGPPGFKGRHRAGLSKRTRKIITYTPQQTIAFEDRVRFYFRNYLASQEEKGWKWDLLQGPLVMMVIAAYPMTTAVTRKWEKLLKSVPVETLPTNDHIMAAIELLLSKDTKPDWDNVGKAVSDALNKLAYRDDGQISVGQTVKCYATGPQSIGIHVVLGGIEQLRTSVVEIMRLRFLTSLLRRDNLFYEAHEGKL